MQKSGCRKGRCEELFRRDPALERGRKRRIDSARMQAYTDSLRMRPGEFDGRGSKQHVECGLGGPIAVPAAEPIVLDAPHPRGKRCKNGFLRSPQQRQKMLGDQRRANRVDGQALAEVGGRELSEALFWLQSSVVQDARGNEDEVEPVRLAGNRAGGCFDRCLVGEVEGQPVNPLMSVQRASKGDGRTCCAVKSRNLRARAECFYDGVADAPTRTYDAGMQLPAHAVEGDRLGTRLCAGRRHLNRGGRAAAC